MFLPDEQLYKCAQLYECINHTPKEDIFICTMEEHRSNINYITRTMYARSADIHQWHGMEYLIQEFERLQHNKEIKSILFIMFYLKYNGIYQTNDTIDKDYVDFILDDNKRKFKQDWMIFDIYCNHFRNWMEEQRYVYMRKIYFVIMYILYYKYWINRNIAASEIIKNKDISEGLIEQLNEQYGDERIPLLNKSIDY